MNQVDLIKKIVRETVAEILETNANQTNKNTFIYIINMLESIDSLKYSIELDELDIKDLEKEDVTKTTYHSIKKNGGSPAVDDELRHLQKICSRMRKMQRTKNELKRLENAMFKMKDEEDYDILELKYLQHISDEDIATMFNCSIRTILRKRNRLIKKLQVILLGADALDT